MNNKNSWLASLVAIIIAATPMSAMAADVAAGEKIKKKCIACHSFDEGKNKVGPSLYKIFGKAAGSSEGYKYGKSTVKAGENGLVWNEETLDGYLANPKKYLRALLDDKKAKSKMAFKLKKEDQRKDLIAYLKSVSEAE